jgi:tetratricopeptide (TPR) repeat protein
MDPPIPSKRPADAVGSDPVRSWCSVTYGARSAWLRGLVECLIDPYAQHGRYAQAVDCLGQALEIARDTGDLPASSKPTTVIALDLATELRQPQDQACAHDGLAHTHHAISQRELARRHRQAALDILATHGIDRTEDPQVTTTALRAHVTNLDPGTQPS